jgi:hypothetical protein
MKNNRDLRNHLIIRDVHCKLSEPGFEGLKGFVGLIRFAEINNLFE